MEDLKQNNKTNIERSEGLVEISNLELAIDCLTWVAADFQLNPKHEDYLGFINIDPNDFSNPAWKEFFSTLYRTHRYFQVVFDHFELRLEEAIQTEIIISKKINHGN